MLQVSAGVSIAQYQVYCHLVQAGYIVTRYVSPLSCQASHGNELIVMPRLLQSIGDPTESLTPFRHPAVWVLDDEQDPQQVWGSESTMEKQPLLQDAYEHAAIPFADRVGQAWPDVQVGYPVSP